MESKEEFLHVYITDALKFISKNTSIDNGGSYIEKRFYDFIKPTEKSQEPEKTGEEIIAETIARMGLKKA